MMNYRANWSTIFVLMAFLSFGSYVYANDEPPLPLGLGEEYSEPALPSGLDGDTQEPSLPEGLDETTDTEKTEMAKDETPRLFDFSGFWEARAGIRTQHDEHEKDMSIGETRLQIDIEKQWEGVLFKLVNDFLYDSVLDEHDVKLEEVRGFIYLRELSFTLTPTDFMDVKLGRQILTWGTGDLFFINDLFPKDWNAFFIGRNTNYLKAPSDALKVSLFSDWLNLDIVYTPSFDSDRFIDGKRISYWNNNFMRRTGRDNVVESDKPNRWFRDDEIALRLYRNIASYELAFYGYRGFWKSPNGFDEFSGKARFPDLSVYGASIRGSISKGIGNIEVGYYDSSEDRDGNNPFVRNSEFRLLVGYEQEVAQNLTLGIQYYLEHMMKYYAYRQNLPQGLPAADENRHVITLRLTKLLMNQELRISLFTFYSPSDEDTYMRPNTHYKITDHWSVEIGGNVFIGKRDHTFFGQFEKNNNVYIGVQYCF